MNTITIQHRDESDAILQKGEQVHLVSILASMLLGLHKAMNASEVYMSKVEKRALTRDILNLKELRSRIDNLSQSDELTLIQQLKRYWFRYELCMPEGIKAKLFDRLLSKQRQEMFLKHSMHYVSSGEMTSEVRAQVAYSQLKDCVAKLECGPLLVIDELKLFL